MSSSAAPFKSGFVAIVGWPNVGKSSLLNAFLNTKLSIITPKAQTTRESILGILNEKQLQMIFLDTPGWLKPRDQHQEMMKQAIVKSIFDDADVIVWVIDPSSLPGKENDFLNQMAKVKKPVLTVLNKMDSVDEPDSILEKLRDILPADFALFPVSAQTKQGIPQLKKKLMDVLPVGDPYYPQDQITDRWERFYVAELIREQIFKLFDQELPHASIVEIKEFKERPQKKDYIQACIYVETEGQKRIFVGTKGRMIRTLSEKCRKEIERQINRPIFLELKLIVKPKWRKNIDFIRQIKQP